jgi:RNA polymerase-binding transcription factor DksA
MPAAGKGGARRPAKTTKKPAKAAKKAANAAKKSAPRAKPATARTKTSSTKATKASKATKRAAPAKTQKASKPAKVAAKPAKVAAKPAKVAAKPAKAPGPAAAKAAPVKKGGKKTVICELSGFEVTPSAPNLSPKTLDRLKRRLLEERERLLRQSEELAAEAEQLAREREGGDTQFDEESGEGDTVNVERERDLLLSASARQDVEDIDVALVRMKRGTYGVCKYAGRRLPLERLELLPWADVCVDCKARAERRR